jgi:hypothetical protein
MRLLVEKKLRELKADIEIELGEFKIIGQSFQREQLLIEASGLYYLASLCHSSISSNRLLLEEVLILKKTKKPKTYFDCLEVCNVCRGSGLDFSEPWGHICCSKCDGDGWLDWTEKITGKRGRTKEMKDIRSKVSCMQLDDNQKPILTMVTNSGYAV